ncbi:uncharacterized protein CEXT_320351 [Caerostris extrusa]|uniref:Uncharacterized protein n=1 Tax=Caerostris extrusa TaxID=172846 RepID=A0AAV4UWI7_CAEEX|nr:uncharacterized protein CEXT_320351 [Caerostris extrusa]
MILACVFLNCLEYVSILMTHLSVWYTVVDTGLTPMQWTADNFSGGFTDNLTTAWFPVNPDHFCHQRRENQQNRLQEFHRVLSFRRNVLRTTRKKSPEAYGNVKVITTTAGPTRTRVRSRSFTLSPGAAFVAEVTLLYMLHQLSSATEKTAARKQSPTKTDAKHFCFNK